MRAACRLELQRRWLPGSSCLPLFNSSTLAPQGMGGFGSVYEGRWRGRAVAVKKLPQFGPDQPCGEHMYAALVREIQLASKFSCDR